MFSEPGAVRVRGIGNPSDDDGSACDVLITDDDEHIDHNPLLSSG